MRNKYIKLMLVFLSALILSGCMEDNELKRAFMEVNKQCPIDIGSSGEITAIEYDKNILTCRVTMNEEYVNVKALSSHTSTLKVSTLATITESDGDIRKLFELVAKEGTSIRYVYKGSNTGIEVPVHLFASQIQNALNEKRDAGKNNLEAEIRIANLSMPMDTGEGVVIQKVKLCGNVVCYMCDVDEKIISINELKKNINELKRNLKQSLQEMSEKDKELFLKKILKSGYGLAYNYKGTTTGKEITVTFNKSEIDDILW